MAHRAIVCPSLVLAPEYSILSALQVTIPPGSLGIWVFCRQGISLNPLQHPAKDEKAHPRMTVFGDGGSPVAWI